MGNISVNTVVMSRQMDQFKDVEKKLNDISRDILRTKRQLNWKVSSASHVGVKLQVSAQNVAGFAAKTGQMSTTLGTIVNTYQGTEKRAQVIQNVSTSANNRNSKSGSQNSGWEEFNKELLNFDTINKFIGKAGLGGGLISGVLSIAKNGKEWIEGKKTGAESIASLGKDIKSVTSGIINVYDSNKKLDKLSRMLPQEAKNIKRKRFFGFNKYYPGASSSASNFGAKWSSNWNKIVEKKGGMFDNYKKGGVKGGLAWGGLIINGASNAVSNYHEYKDNKISGGRAVAETVVETGVDVAKDWVISTAVATTLVTVTSGAAPVLAVGAATVGVSMALDYASKKLTKKFVGEEKGLTEVISDAAIDLATAAGKTITSGVKLISNIFRAR